MLELYEQFNVGVVSGGVDLILQLTPNGLSTTNLLGGDYADLLPAFAIY